MKMLNEWELVVFQYILNLSENILYSEYSTPEELQKEIEELLELVKEQSQKFQFYSQQDLNNDLSPQLQSWPEC